MRVELFLALRILRDSRTQSVLIAIGVAVGVAVVVFLSALIGGLQEDLISKTVGSQADITVRAAEERPRPLRDIDDPHVVRNVQRIERRVQSIDGWQSVLKRLRTTSGVASASPVCRGPASAVRGNAVSNVVLTGIEASTYTKIVDLQAKLVDGQVDTSDRAVLLGVRLASDLGARVGDKIRLEAGAGGNVIGEVFDVRGILDFGARGVDESLAIVSLRNAQSLLDLSGGVTELEASVESIFEAAAVAGRIRAETALDAESWMESNAELLAGLRSQSASSALIQVFVLLAVTIGIASVLVVSVVQRKREIGILRAIGLTRGQTLRVFLIEGCLLAVAGSVIGSGLGAGMVTLFQDFVKNQEGRPLFPVQIELSLLFATSGLAILVGLVAALIPARSAARLDPAVAIRND